MTARDQAIIEAVRLAIRAEITPRVERLDRLIDRTAPRPATPR